MGLEVCLLDVLLPHTLLSCALLLPCTLLPRTLLLCALLPGTVLFYTLLPCYTLQLRHVGATFEGWW